MQIKVDANLNSDQDNCNAPETGFTYTCTLASAPGSWHRNRLGIMFLFFLYKSIMKFVLK